MQCLIMQTFSVHVVQRIITVTQVMVVCAEDKSKTTEHEEVEDPKDS